MKVSELIVELQKLDPNAEVIMQDDPEGNGHKKLSGVDPNGVLIEDAWGSEIYWTADEANMDQKEWDHYLRQPRCVVLFPS